MNPSEIVGLTLILGVILTILGMYGYEAVGSSELVLVEDKKYWQKICISSSVGGIGLIIGTVLVGQYVLHIPQLG